MVFCGEIKNIEKMLFFTPCPIDSKRLQYYNLITAIDCSAIKEMKDNEPDLHH